MLWAWKMRFSSPVLSRYHNNLMLLSLFLHWMCVLVVHFAFFFPVFCFTSCFFSTSMTSRSTPVLYPFNKHSPATWVHPCLLSPAHLHSISLISSPFSPVFVPAPHPLVNSLCVKVQSSVQTLSRHLCSYRTPAVLFPWCSFVFSCSWYCHDPNPNLIHCTSCPPPLRLGSTFSARNK